MNFKECLKIGKYYENKSIFILHNHGFKDVILDNSYNSYYDISALYKHKIVYIEVKYNSLTDKTHKIFLECLKYDKYNNINISGLSITRAKYYIFFSNTKYYIIKTLRVKKILEKTIRRQYKKLGLNKPSQEDLIKYIEHKGIRTKNTIGILINVEDVKKHSIYYGLIINKIFNN